MRDVFELGLPSGISQSSYVRSYSAILSHFTSIQKFQENDYVCCAHMVYGWMPTILEIYLDESFISIGEAAELLQKAKNNECLSFQEVESLAKITNNSLVGSSKILHFTNPEMYPIWDSRIYCFVFEENPYSYRVVKVEKYFQYIERLKELVNDSRFPDFYRKIVDRIGYRVTKFRALELGKL